MDSVLDRAKGKEKKYDWPKAAELYEQALHPVGRRDLLRKGEIQERIAHCLYRAAFQAQTQEEFRKRIELSVEAYDKAAGLSERLKGPKKHTRINFYNARASYNKSWLVEKAPERKALLDECWKLEKNALKTYEETGDRLGYGKTCNELLTCLYDRLWLTWDTQERRNILEEAVEHGERAIEVLSKAGDEYELARTHYMMSYNYSYIALSTYESIEKQKEIIQKSLTYAHKALHISEKTGDLYLIGMSSYVIWWLSLDLKSDFESLLRCAKRQLEQGSRIKDNLMIARACEGLALGLWVKTKMEEDPDKREKGFNKAIQLAEEAMTHYQQVSYPFTYLYGIHTDCYSELAFCETNLEGKRVLLKKAVDVGRKDLEQAKRSGSFTIFQPFRSLSKALYLLSTIETKTSEKRKLLEEASKYKEEAINLLKQTLPYFYWAQGVEYNYSALIKAELAKIETNNQKRKTFLKKAVLDMEDCLKFCKRTTEALPYTRYVPFIGQYQYWFGGILNQLHLLTGQKKHFERAIEVYEDAAQTWGKAGQHSRVAEAHWQKAQLYDHLGQHSEAAREFGSASERYKLAAEKIPQLKAFYTDYAAYMQAWNENAKARHQHMEKNYGLAKEHYEKVADLHKSTRWNHLSPNYSAWARLEEAEDLSRREQTEEAKDLFQQAANLFVEAKKSIKVKLGNFETTDEKEMAARLVKASDIRREYCLGRTALEEARILDRQGDHAASSRKYASAAERFQRATDAVEYESDRRELRPIVYLCRAWQMMTRAEAEASPGLYLEASQLFDEAKEHSVGEKAKVLALGHSLFCRALEVGTRFEETRDTTFYLTAKKHIEAATNYYLKAGFKTASEYAKATYRLFDAYMFTYKAQTETDPRKKSQSYQMAEKLLEASAGSYMKAKHPGKSQEVGRLLESVKEERQLATSLAEVLHAPIMASTPASFSTPTPLYEKAVGLERFEHAHVQARLFTQLSEVRVGDDITLEIALVNAGKGPATLVKVEDIVPVGFNVIEKPEMYRLEDSCLNLRGRRLNPLGAEDVEIVVKPRSKGKFIVKPRVSYLDENGQYKSHEPEPVTITVKELGIRGWIKGER